MSALALDPVTGDLLLEGGRARLIVGAEAVAQCWKTRITMFRGECFRDRSLGIDYQNDIFEKNVRPAVRRAIFAQTTRETPGVREVTDLRLELNPATRVLTVSAEVVLESGEETTLGLSEPVGG